MKKFGKIALLATTFLAPVALATSAFAQSLPTGGIVTNGAASIDTSVANTTTITQTTGRAVINWSSFNVDTGNTVVFAQPDINSATLNRVTGTVTSTIAGTIQATGSVYLINPNGIQITSTGTVTVGRGFVASTLDISDADFMADRNIFTGTGGILNTQGSITTGTGGFVGLLGGEVQAGGTIVAPAGTVTIGTTTKATLDLNGGNFLQVTLPTSAALAGNGTVAALNADAARNAVRHMVNLPASVEATAVSGTNGDVTLSGTITTDGGNVNVSAMGDIGLTGSINVAGAATGGSTVTLRSDAIGTTTGTVTAATNSITTNASGAVNIYYNPASYAAPTNYSSSLVSGSGPVTAYMLVNNVTQLQAINTNLSGTYALSRDIDATATAGWNGGAGFAPVGDYFTIFDPIKFIPIVGGTQFTGSFDGQNRMISGLTINRATQDNVGLFGATNNSALIRNVGLVGGSVTGRNSVGGLVGRNVSGSISNAYATGAVSGNSDVGGLAGSVENGSTINNAYATGTVTGTGRAGGLVGFATGSISNAYATGAVTGNGDVGGLVGGARGSISNAYATGSVTGTGSLGGLVGQAINATISNAYSDSYSTGQSAAVGSNFSTSITNLNAVTSDPSQSGAANYAYNASAYANFDLTNTWFIVDGSTRPFLRSEYSTTITNSHQLQLVALDLGASYTLGRDIDLSETSRVVVGTPGSYAGIWSAAGFAPLITSASDFTGTFDGLGRVISNLTINRTNEDFVGLFSRVTGGTIRNVGLVGGTVVGNNSVGGLAGTLGFGGTATNVYSTGAVIGNGEVGGLLGRLDIGGGIRNTYATGTVAGLGLRVGGLVGSAFGSSISSSYATAAVTGTDAVGGLVGDFLSAAIDNTYASGTVTGINDVGGLVGRGSFGTITNSYATGAVLGTNQVGGLVGTSLGSNIRNVYAAGAVSGATNVGGLVGTADGIINNSYWDSFSTGQISGFGTSTASITNLSTVTSDPTQSGASNYAFSANAYANFTNTSGASDVDTVGGQPLNWRIYEGNTRPLLKVFLRNATASASGTSNSRVYNGAVQTINGIVSFLETNIDTSRIFGTGTALASGTNVGSYASVLNTSGLYSNQQGFDIVTGPSSFALTITARPITVSADALSRVYGDANPALTFVVGGSGLVGSDTLSGALASSANATSNVGSFAITQGTLDNSNYALTYIGADLSVTPRALNVVYTADTANRVYGGANPALSGSVASTGLVNGDTLSGTANFTSTASATSNVGGLSIIGSGLTASSNYTLITSQAVGNAAALSITARPITVSADALSRVYGDANPALLGSVASTCLVNGDALSGTASFATIAASSNIACCLGFTESRPLVHDGTALLQQVCPLVSAFSGIADSVLQTHFGNFTREVGALGGPIPEG